MIQWGSAGRALLQAVALGLMAAVAAGLVQVVRPDALPWRQAWSQMVEIRAQREKLPLLTLAEARQAVEQHTHILLDARPLKDYDAGRIPGALALPHAAKDAYLPAILPALTPAQPILTYCSGRSCDEGLLLALDLRKLGYTNVALFAGGYTEWKAAGLKVEP